MLFKGISLKIKEKEGDFMDWEKVLADIAKQDEHYQNCLNEVQELEILFLRLREMLSPTQRELLDRYLSACDELDHAMVRLAYQLGREEK